MKGRRMGLFSRLMGKTTSAANDELAILAPVSGELVPLEETHDPVFSGRKMGDGVAVVPTSGTVCAPVTGSVSAIFPTAHALAIAPDDANDAQVMVHIGIDTVRMNGEGFTALVAQGDHVDAGQPLVEVDLDAVRASGYDPTVFVVVCERADGSTVRERAAGPACAKDPVLWLSK